jgi:hypothetical protein
MPAWPRADARCAKLHSKPPLSPTAGYPGGFDAQALASAENALEGGGSGRFADGGGAEASVAV